ncbi:hypothetical protein BGW39_002247 [Mortierella sp. 14UC]|nr:hypothetical protein BGW39_002247 [Mortierella sp. 14UC]
MSLSIKLFDILELTTLVADHLFQKDLAACCLVNHSWLNTFSPHLWHTIAIRKFDAISKFTTPEGCTGLVRNSHHIRILRTYNLESLGPFLEFGASFRNLVVLDAEYGPGAGRNMTLTNCRLRSGDMLSKERGGRRTRKEESNEGRGADEQRQSAAAPKAVSECFEASQEERERTARSCEPEDLEQARALLGVSLPTAVSPFYTVNELDPRQQVESRAKAMELAAEARILKHACEVATKRRENKARQLLVSVLEQYPSLEFLIVPEHCLESEVVAKVAVEGLPLLREMYTSSTMWRWGVPAKFWLTDHRQWPRLSICVPSFGSQQQQQQAKTLAQEKEGNETKQEQELVELVDGLRGTLLKTECTLPKTFLEGYPRLRDLEQNMVKSINHAALERIRNASEDFVCLEISNAYATEIIQTLREVPRELLTSITLTNFYCSLAFLYGNEPIDKIGQSVFLRHASTLEHLFARAYAIESKDIGDLLCASPRLKTLELIQEDMPIHTFVESELDLQDAVRAPWVCDKLEDFECRISGVPRPDLTYDFFYYDRSFAPYPPIPPCPKGLAVEPTTPQQFAQQQSYALQRKFLKQLDQLTHLRVLTLGSNCPAYESRDKFALVLRGIRTMIVAENVQHQCLELTLESGLDELAGLKELEEVNVYEMAHWIGIAEVRWMVEQWPRLRALRGLWCGGFNRCFEVDYETRMGRGAGEVGGGAQGAEVEVDIEEAEHIVWLKKHRPDMDIEL